MVDDTPAAQHCVDLLRDRKLGVATFLILDKQAHLAQKASEKASPPEGAVLCPQQLACCDCLSYISHLSIMRVSTVSPLLLQVLKPNLTPVRYLKYIKLLCQGMLCCGRKQRSRAQGSKTPCRRELDCWGTCHT